MDSKRLKLGILFYFSQQWMGGIIYIMNIIKTLNVLDENEKPAIFLFYRSELKKFVDEIEYPYLVPIEWSFPTIVKGNIISLIKRKNAFVNDIIKNYMLDTIYPLHDFPVRTNTNTKLISWCADVQYKHYPEFFSKLQILERNIRIKLSLRNNDYLIVSSQAVLNDFKKFFKLRSKLKIHIFHFVSIIDNMENQDIEDVKKKFNLPEKYFLVSNQFHKHKNHRVILFTLARLKEKGIKKHIAFTGKFPITAKSKYLAELHQIIENNNLQDQISFLGLISRSEQLTIMKHSQAVIQPSLFEGWSTVIEDAISLQVPVIASNLEVNIEQLGKDGLYFNPGDPVELASILSDFPERNLNDQLYETYSIRVKKAAIELIKILRK